MNTRIKTNHSMLSQKVFNTIDYTMCVPGMKENVFPWIFDLFSHIRLVSKKYFLEKILVFHL